MKAFLFALSLASIPALASGAISSASIYSSFDGGLGAPGTINGAPGSVAGKVGDALSFSRNDDDFVDYGNTGGAGTGSLSVSMWISANQASGGAFFPVGKGNRSSGTVGWSFFLENDVIIARAAYDGGGGDLRLGANHPFSVGTEFAHVGLVIDNDAGTFTAYFNGESSGASGNENGWSLGGGGGQTNTFTPGQDFTTAENLLVGRRSSNGASFDGAIDEFAVWNSALSDADMSELYQRGAASQPIPEPTSALLLGLGALLGFARRRRA